MNKTVIVFGLVALALAGLCMIGVPMDAAHATLYGAATVTAFPLTNDNNSTTRAYPIDKHGKLRVAYFKYTNDTGGALAAGTQIDLLDLPFGRVRVLRNLSRYNCTALGAARTLSIGNRLYNQTSTPATDAGTAEDKTTLVNVKDVSGAVNDVAFDGGAAKAKFDFFSRVGVRLFAQVDGDTIPANAVVEGYVVYVCE